MLEFVHNPFIVKVLMGVAGGLVAAVAVDYHVFLGFKNDDDFVSYDWKTARFRWFQGLVAGFVSGCATAGIGRYLGF